MVLHFWSLSDLNTFYTTSFTSVSWCPPWSLILPVFLQSVYTKQLLIVTLIISKPLWKLTLWIRVPTGAWFKQTHINHDCKVWLMKIGSGFEDGLRLEGMERFKLGFVSWTNWPTLDCTGFSISKWTNFKKWLNMQKVKKYL